jgi:hypothetical protein
MCGCWCVSLCEYRCFCVGMCVFCALAFVCVFLPAYECRVSFSQTRRLPCHKVSMLANKSVTFVFLKVSFVC